MKENTKIKQLYIYDGVDYPVIEVDGFPVKFKPFDDKFEIDWNGAKLTIQGLSKLTSSLQ